MAKNPLPPLPVKERRPDSDLLKKLIDSGVPAIYAKILAAREISEPKEASSLGKNLLPWAGMKGIAESSQMLADAIQSRQRIVVVADYDSDGATSCAIAIKALRSMGAVADFAVPNRFVHGYGLTAAVVEQVAKEFDPEIIITVDNGISSHDGIEKAHMRGIKVLVTDHHLPPEVIPPADCIVNPNQPGCEFPSKNLAGCGVIFYVMAALREELKKRSALPPDALPPQALLDFAAIGTIADVVKLDENNRVLARLGLERIRQGRAHPGVAALFAVARRSMPQATSKDIGFAIGPRINAAGRLDDMSIGIRCLLADDFQEALELALKLDDLNRARKEIESGMQSEAQEQIEADWKSGTGGLPNAIVVKDASFHEGVIGIVAGRIKEKEHRPTIVFAPAQEAGSLKGSGRSIPGFHLRDALDLVHKRNPGILSKFGGHAMAAGMSLPEQNFEKFRDEFDKAAGELLTEEMLARYILTDGDLPGDDITLDFAERLAAEVWGQGFPEPVFHSRLKIREQRLIKDSHLKMEVEKDGQIFDAMWFFKDSKMSSGEIDAVYSIAPSEYKGDVFVQLMIVQAEDIGEPFPED